MVPCHSHDLARCNAGREAEAKYECNRNEAATGNEEFFEIEPRLLAET